MFNFVMYADDTTLSATICNFQTNKSHNLDDQINFELSKVNDWLKVNKLPINVNKTTYMLFHTPNKVVPELDIKIQDTRIERVDHFDFLGITVDKNLS